jgi:excisionase family DNA binding protein
MDAVTDAEALCEFIAGAIAKAVTVDLRNGRQPPRMALPLAQLLHTAASGGTARQDIDRPRKGQDTGTMAAPSFLVDAREAAHLLSVCERTVRTMAADGRLVAVKIGGAVRYRRADLEALVAASPRTFRDSVSVKDTPPSARVGRGFSPSLSADPISQPGAA